MLKTNYNDLPILLVQGQVRHSKGSMAYRHTIDGEPMTLPATGGITLNAMIGDRCVGWAADHLEPGVTMRNENDDYNAAVQGLSCIGNVASSAAATPKAQPALSPANTAAASICCATLTRRRWKRCRSATSSTSAPRVRA